MNVILKTCSGWRKRARQKAKHEQALPEAFSSSSKQAWQGLSEKASNTSHAFDSLAVPLTLRVINYTQQPAWKRDKVGALGVYVERSKISAYVIGGRRVSSRVTFTGNTSATVLKSPCFRAPSSTSRKTERFYYTFVTLKDGFGRDIGFFTRTHPTGSVRRGLYAVR